MVERNRRVQVTAGQVRAQLLSKRMGAEVDSQVAAPTETRTPNWHRANYRSQTSADGRMAAEADRFDQDHSTTKSNTKTHLTLTGLLMEGCGKTKSHRHSEERSDEQSLFFCGLNRRGIPHPLKPVRNDRLSGHFRRPDQHGSALGSCYFFRLSSLTGRFRMPKMFSGRK
jgi:hypothetical protein